MVDPIRQKILSPFHEWTMSILSSIPQDGTYDQMRPIRRLVSTGQHKEFFCYDLSSATDSMPIGAYNLTDVGTDLRVGYR